VRLTVSIDVGIGHDVLVVSVIPRRRHFQLDHWRDARRYLGDLTGRRPRFLLHVDSAPFDGVRSRTARRIFGEFLDGRTDLTIARLLRFQAATFLVASLLLHLESLRAEGVVGLLNDDVRIETFRQQFELRHRDGGVRRARWRRWCSEGVARRGEKRIFVVERTP
jgi:hypothetical protein